MQREALYYLPVLLALAACSRPDKAPPPDAERDPAAAAALDDPIMTDPDLVLQNRGDSALSGGGPPPGDLPDFDRTSEAAEAARTAAHIQLGSVPPRAPGPTYTRPQSRLTGSLTMPALAAAAGIAALPCADQLGFTMAWAARLPAGLPVYPRGHAIMAAGSDQPGCIVRAVRYVTPVAVSDAVDYYFATTRAASLPAERRREGSDEVVAGGKSGAAYAVYVRQRRDGLTEVDIFTAGL